MSDILPISCVSCRRRKIKCNKKKPCDQCMKRQVVCEFPATFRNIKISENDFKTDPQEMTNDQNSSPSSSSSFDPPTIAQQAERQDQILHQPHHVEHSQHPPPQPIMHPQQQPHHLHPRHQHHHQHHQHQHHHQQHPSQPQQQSTLSNPEIPVPIPLNQMQQKKPSNASSSGGSSNSVMTTITEKSNNTDLTGIHSISSSSDGMIKNKKHSSNVIASSSDSKEGSNQETESRSDSSNTPMNSQALTAGRTFVDPGFSNNIDNYILLKENFDMMRAANTQLLDENRALTHRLEEMLQKVLNVSEKQSNKRDRTSDSSSEDLPYKKEKVGFFGHSKSSFPKDSASENQGMYSNIHLSDDNSPPKESSSTSGGSSSDEVVQQIPSEAQALTREQLSQRKVHKPKKLKSSSVDTQVMNHQYNDWEKDIETLHSQESLKSSNLVERSLKKKKLPILPSYLLKYDDPDVSTDSETYQDVFNLNFEIIIKLVHKFFEKDSQARTFISSAHVFDFLYSYESISDRDWDNDDDLLLVYMILALSIQRLTSKEYVELTLLPAGSITTCTKYRKFLTRNVLHKNFERLRTHLVNESLMTIQAYILCTEWYFLEQKYEECWAMMFHSCSISYSIGLHIMGQYRIHEAKQNKQLNSLISATAEDSDVSDKKELSVSDEGDRSQDEELDINRYRVWFALKNYVSIICSIFGRPNPISVQVGINGSNSGLGFEIPNEEAHILLKIGISESLRLSNLMLIENFMIDFTLPDLMNLSVKFDAEINLLKKWYNRLLNDENESDEPTSSSPASASSYDILLKDDHTNRPLEINELDLSADIIVLYINNAKLFEPFISKFENVKGYDKIVQIQINSVSNFLILLNEFIEKFFKKSIESNFNKSANDIVKDQVSSSSSQHNYGPIKFGKLFKTYYPFLNSFICQGIIVVFTFLHYKSKEFVENNNKFSLNNDFLSLIESNLTKLLGFESKLSTKHITTSRMWSANMVYLINRVLNLIKLIYEKQEDESIAEELKNQRLKSSSKSSSDSSPDNFNLPITTARGSLSYLLNTNPFGDPSQFEYLNGFHLNDPFWLAVPDNLPYYVGSPADDLRSTNNRPLSAGFKQFGRNDSASTSNQEPVTINNPSASTETKDLPSTTDAYVNYTSWGSNMNQNNNRVPPLPSLAFQANQRPGNQPSTSQVSSTLQEEPKQKQARPSPSSIQQQQQQEKHQSHLNRLSQQNQIPTTPPIPGPILGQKAGPPPLLPQYNPNISQHPLNHPQQPQQPQPQHPLSQGFMAGGYMFPQQMSGYAPSQLQNDQSHYYNQQLNKQSNDKMED